MTQNEKSTVATVMTMIFSKPRQMPKQIKLWPLWLLHEWNRLLLFVEQHPLTRMDFSSPVCPSKRRVFKNSSENVKCSSIANPKSACSMFLKIRTESESDGMLHLFLLQKPVAVTLTSIGPSTDNSIENWQLADILSWCATSTSEESSRFRSNTSTWKRKSILLSSSTLLLSTRNELQIYTT